MPRLLGCYLFFILIFNPINPAKPVPKRSMLVGMGIFDMGAALLEPHKSIRHKGLKISVLSREDVRRRY